MENTNTIQFENPSFLKRIKGMLGVDFYRLIHTPVLYIFLAIAAIIPAMIVGTTGTQEGTQLYTNAWQIIAADKPLYIVNSIAEYANMNMVFIFGGIMISIFIGHDYKSGYVKQLFTNHPNKVDYMISKSLIGAMSMSLMCITYLLGGVLASMLTGLSFEGSALSIICAILGKIIMSLGWSALYTFINVIFRRMFGISITLSFILGTGIIIIGFAGIIGNNCGLNIFLYGASVYACLSSNFLTILVCLLNSIIWFIIYIVTGKLLLSNRDVY